MRFNTFYSKSIQLLKIYVVLVLLFFVIRLVAIFNFNNTEVHYEDILAFFWTGFRFDTVVITYLFAFLLVFMFPVFLVRIKRYNEVLTKGARVYTFIIIYTILVISTIDYYYYKFFHTHFDNMVFGIVQDDTKAVLVSVWKDYPIIKIVIGFILGFFLIRRIVKQMFTKTYKFPSNSYIAKFAYVLVFLSVFFLGMRGSLGTFPIGKDNMVVCSNTLINDFTPNSIFYLKETIADRIRFQISTEIDPILEKYKYPDPEQALAEYLSLDDEASLSYNDLESRTPKNDFLNDNKPNVVVILMESFGNHYLDLHSKELNLLGELEHQLPYCHLYRNFLPGSNGTIPSLEALVVNSPSCPLSQSKYKDVPLKSSCAYPFKKAGYNTTYITGGDLTWRNTGVYMRNQYFDNVEGRVDILKKVEGASDCTWGVYDEYLFERMLSRLEKANREDEPEFIFGLTTTNHTPFERPKHYNSLPVNINDSIKKQLKTTEKIAVENFTNYQYSSHFLGRFIKAVRESDFGDNTIIVATGDHNCRQLFEYCDEHLYYRYSVPLVLYIPEKYKENYLVDTKRCGSHKDIFPTIYNLSLSQQTYLNSGNNMLDTDTTIYYYGVNDYSLGMDKNGLYLLNSNLSYEWGADSRILHATSNTDKFKKLGGASRSYSFAMDYYVRNLLKISSYVQINSP